MTKRLNEAELGQYLANALNEVQATNQDTLTVLLGLAMDLIEQGQVSGTMEGDTAILKFTQK